jgi:hypothetical protein
MLVGERGMARIAGIVASKAIASAMKTRRKPEAILEDWCSVNVAIVMLTAPPAWRNMPRIPVMVAARSGMSSMQALFYAGAASPTPIPITSKTRVRVVVLSRPPPSVINW